MNERIKEFRFKAAEYANEQKPLGITKWNEVRDAKFAELIVRECAKFLDENSGYDESNNAWHPEPEDLLQHFGVEE